MVVKRLNPLKCCNISMECSARIGRCNTRLYGMEIPSKHETLTQCCFDVGPTSKTVGQHQSNIGSMSRVCWVSIPYLIKQIAVEVQLRSLGMV